MGADPGPRTALQSRRAPCCAALLALVGAASTDAATLGASTSRGAKRRGYAGRREGMWGVLVLWPSTPVLGWLGGSEEVPELLEFRGGGDQALPLQDVEAIIDAVWRVLQSLADRACDGA